MSERRGDATRSERGSRLALYATYVFAVTFVVSFYLPPAWVPESATVAVDRAFFLSWIATPIVVYADIRTVRKLDVGWQPKASWWILGCLLPALHVGAVVAYLLRRYETVTRREPWEHWWRIAGVGVGVFLVVLFLDILLIDALGLESAAIDAALTELASVYLIFGTFLVPVAVKYDVEYVVEHFDWEPEKRLWVVGSAIPVVNVVVVLSYVAKRNPEAPFSVIEPSESRAAAHGVTHSRRVDRVEHSRRDDRVEHSRRDDRVEHSRRDDRVEPDDPKSAGARESRPGVRPAREPQSRPGSGGAVDSNWWYWPAFTVGLTVVAILLGIVVAYSTTTDAFDVGPSSLFLLLGILLALAFVGYASILAIRHDARAIAESEADWQPSPIGYVLAGVLLSPLVPAFVYLVQRHRHLGEP